MADIGDKRKCDKCALFAELKSINSTIMVLFEYPSYFQSNSSSVQLTRSAQHRKIRCCSPWVLVFSPVKIGHLFISPKFTKRSTSSETAVHLHHQPTSWNLQHPHLFTHSNRDIPKELSHVSQRLEGTPECSLDNYLHDEPDPIDSTILILRSRGLTDAEIEKAHRWNRPPDVCSPRYSPIHPTPRCFERDRCTKTFKDGIEAGVLTDGF